MSVELSFSELFSQKFGYESTAFQFDETPNTFSRVQHGNLGSPYYKIDQLGREYFLPVTVTYAGGLYSSHLVVHISG